MDWRFTLPLGLFSCERGLFRLNVTGVKGGGFTASGISIYPVCVSE